MLSTRPTRPTELALSSYGSPLRKPWIGWLLSAMLLALIFFAISNLTSLLDVSQLDRLGVLLLTLAVTGAISIVPVLLVRWLDRREPEPWFMDVLAILWGGLIATGISGVLNGRADAVLGYMLGAILSGPFIEEGAKALGLLVLLLVLRSEFDGPRDGFIYGLLIGLGFNWIETAVYVARGYAQTGSLPLLFQLSSRYALFGLSGHALYTSVTGTFLGFALLQTSWFKRIGLPILGYFLAAFSHMLWNSLGVIMSSVIATGLGFAFLDPQARELYQNDPTQIPFWLNWPATIVAVLVVNLVAIVIVIVGLRRSGRWEKRVMVEQLKDELGSPVVTQDEYANIEARCEPPKSKTGRQIFAAQCNLAKRKFYLALHKRSIADDPLVGIWRDELGRLRGATA
jgi:RsiW-degrading membrane proteinase PrsW (M82 family)